MSHDDLNFEPVRGLPERPPEGEHILWQGAPSAMRLARDALGLRLVAAYFVLLGIWRVGVASTGLPLAQAMQHAVPIAIGGLATCAILYAIAWAQAKATVYTITNRRVSLRIGAALSINYNIPFVQIANARLDLRSDGTGTIALQTLGDTRFSYLMTWPHVRPWVIRRTEPALRCIPDAERVARLLAEAAERRIAEPRIERMPQAAAVAAE